MIPIQGKGLSECSVATIAQLGLFGSFGTFWVMSHCIHWEVSRLCNSVNLSVKCELKVKPLCEKLILLYFMQGFLCLCKWS